MVLNCVYIYVSDKVKIIHKTRIMANNKITTIIECQNIAPIENLTKEIKSNSLKMGVFANNGSGKTFLSRLFRLTEKQEEITLDESGNSSTDKFLSFGKNNGYFSFKITDKNGNVKDDFNISINKGEVTEIPNTAYIYHTFNQDYVEQNIRVLGFEKDSDIQGFILGKSNIDIQDEEEELENIEKEYNTIKVEIEKKINDYLDENINKLANIKRLKEYSYLKPNNIFQGVNKDLFDVTKNIDELFTDYNKVKSVPENLSDIATINKINVSIETLNEIKKNLKKTIFVSEIKNIKDKQEFIETGITLLPSSQDKVCPFCEQELQENALNLIDNYTKFLNDSEAKTIRKFKSYLELLTSIITSLKTTENINSKRINLFNDYKTKYIPASEKTELDNLHIGEIQSKTQILIENIENKIKDISQPISIDDLLIENIEKELTMFNCIINSNNEHIVLINDRKNEIGEENKNIRREICKSAYNHLVETHRNNINIFFELEQKQITLKEEIKEKKELQKVSKRSKVASTIKNVLNYFFSDKYTLDEDTFRLVFDNNKLEKNQAKDVLSEGEKNIVAFAYYIGDTHLKVETEDDYEKLFFIIDDPISSMDFTHVYTLSGVIRNITEIIDKLKREKIIIFTHNIEFMRVLSANNIINKKMLLKKGELKDFNNNLTVPYIKVIA